MNLIVAYSIKDRGIGINGKLPWNIKEDLIHFKKVTVGNGNNVVIMGRKTWESIPEKFRPLPGRFNVVVSSQSYFLTRASTLMKNLSFANDFEEAVEYAKKYTTKHKGEIFVIGGESIYKQALPYVETIYATEVDYNGECDTFFPKISGFDKGVITGQIHNVGKYVKYTLLKPHEEYQYLNLIKQVIDNGVKRGDRTGTGTLSLFGRTMRFNLRNGILPLLTTKRTFWSGIAKELLWFISGDTNAKTLQDQGVKIWDGNSSREYLDSIGLNNRKEGDLGPVYGFQWRHFGAEYKTCYDDYTGQGIDQLKNIIETIKTNPNDRRMILSAWNPGALGEMALPPCHLMCQFYVANGELSCQMYQRSCDLGLGVPFNIASYALLTHLIAKCTGLKTGDFIHVLGDAHVYLNHVEALKEQLEREPFPFPTLRINTENTDIDGFKFEDLEVVGYKSHKRIKMDMAV